MRAADDERFLAVVLADRTVRGILERAPALGVGDWWLTAGVLFQTVWNSLTGRPPGTGIRDADLFYFDADTSWEAEDAAIRTGAELFADLSVPVEIRNEARVHLWYAERFGVPGPAAFRNTCEAAACLRGQGGALGRVLAGADGAALGRRRGTLTDGVTRSVRRRARSRCRRGARCASGRRVVVRPLPWSRQETRVHAQWPQVRRPVRRESSTASGRCSVAWEA